MIQTICRAEAGRHVNATLIGSSGSCACRCGGWAQSRAAGERFEVSAASISRWRALERTQGDASPKPIGGDQRSRRIEAHGDLILSLCEATPDITLQELRAALAARGVSVGYGGLWRFFDRRDST